MALQLKDFEGLWRLQRHITQSNGPEARFDGTARFESDGDGLIYQEDGVLTLAGQAPVRAERRYRWQDGGDRAVVVMFDDGRAFHQIDLTAEQPEDRHHCAPDTYDVAYDFRSWPRWTSCWTVNGPRKAYIMVSEYQLASI